ncbi:MAG: hypothetical protein ACI32C_04755 [Candidatus Enteromonas sp.]
MKKARSFWITLALIMTLASCGGNEVSSCFSNVSSSGEPSSSLPNSSENSSTSEETLSSSSASHDFGDPSLWPGENIKVRDLGDAIMDPFPYDLHYDWGQSVFFDSEDQVYKMWWCRQSPHDTIWYAESHDLKHWHNCQKIMMVEKDTTWIKMHVGKPTVLKINGKYRMYLEAPATIYHGVEFNNNVLMAESDDGIHFHYYGGDEDPQPVIRMTDEELQQSIEYSDVSTSGYGWYGIGQPTAVYKDGTYYLYCTYSLIAGDRLYCFRSQDGIHFDEGTQVFLRAGSGVKYNELTKKFMMAYAYDINGQCRVFYMDSDDGIKFTYSDYAGAAANQNIIARGSGLTRNYPDYVGNESGHVTSETFYATYMEGRMAAPGDDWRTGSATWDIHFAMVNPAEYANRDQVLPNGEVYSKEAFAPYEDKHQPWESQYFKLARGTGDASIDGIKDEKYGKSHEISRISYLEGAIPLEDYKGEISFFANNDALYVYVDASTIGASDHKIVFTAAIGEESIRLTCENGETSVDGSEEARTLTYAFRQVGNGASYEVKIPLNGGESKVCVDSYLYRKASSAHGKSIIAWSDPLLGREGSLPGELILG